MCEMWRSSRETLSAADWEADLVESGWTPPATPVNHGLEMVVVEFHRYGQLTIGGTTDMLSGSVDGGLGVVGLWMY